MAGIGAIGGGLSPYAVTPLTRAAGPEASNPPGASVDTTALGQSPIGNPVRGGGEDGARGIAGASQDLTEEEQKQVDELQQRDREVRQHEQAHVAAAGRYANGGPQFEFTTGPDGRQYATGGHVSIDVSPAATPEATIQKAQVIRRAAQAPAEPSAQDRAVAAQASQLESEARKELQEAQQEAARGGENGEAQSPGGISNTPQAPDPLAPPPALPGRGVSQYQPEATRGGGGGGISGVSRLDVLA